MYDDGVEAPVVPSTLLALELTVTQVLVVSIVLMVALLLLAYGIAGWYERRARRKRERRRAPPK